MWRYDVNSDLENYLLDGNYRCFEGERLNSEEVYRLHDPPCQGPMGSDTAATFEGVASTVTTCSWTSRSSQWIRPTTTTT